MDFSNRIASLKPSAIREIFKVLGDKSIISFAGGNPDPATFPAKEMGDIAGELFRTRPEDALQYSITEGYPPLRKQLSERMKIKFGIGREFDETIIVTGGQQGLDLTCKVLCNEGDVVICEEPSFIGALNCFRATGANLAGIEMEPDGMNIEKLEHVLKTEKRAKMIYIIPTFQNPMGITTSEKKREQIYFLAKKYGVKFYASIDMPQFTPSTGSEISGRTLGVQAFGNVGRLVAAKAAALGMKVLATDPFLTPEQIRRGGAEPVAGVEELYSRSDYVSVHIPATPQTVGSIGRDLICSMPKNAVLVNTARKEVIDEAGLEQALEERPDIRYVTDVAPGNYETLRDRFGLRVFATPKKMGAQTAEANINAGLAAARQIVAYFENGDEKYRLNK